MSTSYEYDPRTDTFPAVSPVQLLPQWQVDDQHRYPPIAYSGEYFGWHYDGIRYVPVYPPIPYSGKFRGWYYDGIRYMPKYDPEARRQRRLEFAGALVASVAMIGITAHAAHHGHNHNIGL